MLTCIACSKQLNTGSLREPEEDDTAATPSKKQAIKALTAQIKDMAVKASGAYKNCKPCSGGSNHNQKPNYTDSETGSVSERFRYSYKRTGSSNLTPRVWGKEMKGRLKVLSSGESTPVSVSGRSELVVDMEDDESKEWVAQVEPGVLITFVSLPEGGNDLKQIRFRVYHDSNRTVRSLHQDSEEWKLISKTSALTSSLTFCSEDSMFQDQFR